MPYTFGAATADDITFTAGSNGFGNGTHSFVAGWWYPTTLTAGRGYFSFGNVAGATVGPTTSEIRLILDGTVDGVWDTTGAGITTNKWWFLAFQETANNTGMAAAWRVWVGDADNRPVAITPAQTTAPTVAFTGSTSRTVGNKGTGTLAFQGDIGWVVMASHAHTAAITLPFGATNGTISAAEALFCEERLVVPLWKGIFPRDLWAGATNTGAFNVCYPLLKSAGRNTAQWTSAGTASPIATTINGATLTQNFPPVMLPVDALYAPPRRLRR